jgi:uncharacterized protein
MSLSSEATNVNWLLGNFAKNTSGVDQAIAVSSDGLLIAMSSGLDRSVIDKLAAVITGVRSLSHGASTELDRGPVIQVLIEMVNAYLFVNSISGGSTLGVVADKRCDLGQVGYEISLLVDRVGAQLTPSLITELKTSLAGV